MQGFGVSPCVCCIGWQCTFFHLICLVFLSVQCAALWTDGDSTKGKISNSQAPTKDILQALTSSEVDTCQCDGGCMYLLGREMKASHCGWWPVRPPVSGGRTFPYCHQSNLTSGAGTASEQLSGDKIPSFPSWHKAQAQECPQHEGYILGRYRRGNHSHWSDLWSSCGPALMAAWVSKGTTSMVWDSPSMPGHWWHRSHSPVSIWSALWALWWNLRSSGNSL